ncbi:MAG: hypothetical protein ACREL5_07145 [Gemmatimonadales bacterium]
MVRSTVAIRRWFGLFGALWMLALPATQAAHAEVMMRNGCAGMAAMTHHGAESGQRMPPVHDASCCDLCFAGCSMTVLPTARPAPILTAVVLDVAPVAPVTSSIVVRFDHVLPFPLAPPRFSV